MAKSVLVFVLSLFLLSSFNVYGAKKPVNYEKMAQRLEKIEKARYPDESIVSRYLLTPKPRVLLPATGDTVGYTYYDYQANRRQIANGTDGIIHFTWMNLVGPDMSYNRYIDYNAWNFQDWLAPGGMHVTPDSGRGGYTGLDLLPDDREVLGYHRNYPITPAGAFWGTTLSIDIYPGSGDFNSFDIPDSCAGFIEKGLWTTVACSKMTNGDTSYIHVTHTQQVTGDANRDLGYIRCFEKPSNWDTLVCVSPGWGSPLLIPKDTKLVPNKVPYRFTICRLGGTVVATSPVSQKVAVVWLQTTATSATQNEVKYLESTNNGNDWITAGDMGTPVQVTDYEADGYINRAYPDIAAVYDYNDNLHIIWTTFKSDYVNDVTLWHWNSALPGIRKVTSLNAGAIESGSYNLCIAKPTIGVEYMEGDSAYNYLYVVYTRFWYSDISAGGYANGDLRLMASSNGGLTWRGPQESLASLNLTNTNSNGCTPGNCESEHWASIAERVDIFLYIQYIYDRDAGGIPMNEGTFTNNPVRYLKYPRPLIPAIPKMGYPYIFMTSTLNNSSNTDSIVISNDGSATLYVQLSGPSWITSIPPSNFSIAEAGSPQIVHLTCNGAGFQDTILIDSLKIVSNNGYVGGGPNYVDTVLGKSSFCSE